MEFKVGWGRLISQLIYSLIKIDGVNDESKENVVESTEGPRDSINSEIDLLGEREK